MIDEKTRRFAANSIFPSFFLAAFGFVLGQVWAAQVSGSWWLHAVLGIPGMTASGLAFYRARLHWSAGIARSGDRRLRFNAQDFAWYVVLFSAGIIVALCSGSVFLLGIVAALMYLVPWEKIRVCRTRFSVSSFIALAGAIAWLARNGQSMRSLHYVVAAWLVLIPPMVMLFVVILSLPDQYRVRGSA